MNSSHEHHEHTPPAPASTPVDSGSQALAEALRSSFAIVRFVMVLLVAVFLGSGFFTVEQQEKAIILRFGRPLGEGDQALLGAGLHWALPYPIDEVVKVPISEIQTLQSTTGWYATAPGMEDVPVPPGAPLNPAVDGYALTADGNIVHTRATLRYRVADPIRCVFGFTGDTNRTYTLAGVSNAVQNALDNALLRTAARFTVDQIVTRDVAGFQDAVRRRFEELVRRQELGILVDQCQVQSAPPRQLKPEFDRVITAGLDQSKELNGARSYENQITNQSAADAVALVNAAETERTRYLEDLAADTERFKGLLPKFESNPDLYLQQRLVETMGRVLTNTEDKIFLPERADGKPRELRLLLNREPQKPKSAQAQP